MSAIHPGPPDDMDQGKQHLRNRLKTAREELTPGERAEKSRTITGLLLELLEGYDTVMVYAAKEPEVETGGLIDALLAQGTKVVVPIIQRENRTLRLSYLEDRRVLCPSTFNVPEPVDHEIPAEAGDIGAAVIPLIGFDACGHRIGYGAGYYDRFLGTHDRILRIGIGFACQRVNCLPSEPHDIFMHYIVTEDGIIRCG
jgi:5-formyltetrahydrofolate cyclo-ligase